MIGFDHRLARASQPANVRAFAEHADAFLEAAGVENAFAARAYLHLRGFGYVRIEPGTVSVDMPRTRRSTVTTVTARIHLDADGTLSGTCECEGAAAACEHLAAVLAALVDRCCEDDRHLMRFQGLSEADIEAVLESRRPGRTRWAATAYTEGCTVDEALARDPGPLPPPPTPPREAASPRYADTVHLRGSNVSAHQLELQAAIAAAAAREALSDAAAAG
jgi:hypothetical protein